MRKLPEGMTIGPARTQELETICTIAREAWAPIHEAMVADVGEDLHERLAGDWRSRKADQIRRQFREHPEWVLVVRSGDEVAAFVTFGLDRDRSIGTIRNNAVRPAWQGRGIGTAMYEHVLALFRTSGMAYAAVDTGLDPGHAPARTAYERVGFDLRREHVTYYQKLD